MLFLQALQHNTGLLSQVFKVTHISVNYNKLICYDTVNPNVNVTMGFVGCW